MFKFIKTSLLGGLVFLTPIVILIFVLGKAYKIMLMVAKPLAKIVPVESIMGVAAVNIIAGLIILIICFLAGMFAKSAMGKGVFNFLDDKLTALFPGYSYLKSAAESIKGESEHGKSLKPVLVAFDDHILVAFKVEQTVGDMVVVYIPGSPDPRAGSVVMVEEDRVSPVDQDFLSVLNSLKRFGLDSKDLVNLEQIQQLKPFLGQK